MIERFAPSDRTYSDDPAEQAFCAYQERRIVRLGSAFAAALRSERLRSPSDLQDLAWDHALDFVAPVEPDVRDELRRDVPELPWDDRIGVRLYWRLMHAAYAESILDRHAPLVDVRRARRCLMPIAATLSVLVGQFTKAPGSSDPDFLAKAFLPGATPIGHAVYLGIIERAGEQIRIRHQRLTRPTPFAPHARVRVGRTTAEVSGYGFDGSVGLSRETEPDDRAGLDWRLDTRDGRWHASAWPDRLVPAP